MKKKTKNLNIMLDIEGCGCCLIDGREEKA
jgi:hypothetical protein